MLTKYKHCSVRLAGDIYVFRGNCRCCGCERIIEVPKDHWEVYKSGVMIQNALINLDANEREFLISATCEKCWDELFGEGE